MTKCVWGCVCVCVIWLRLIIEVNWLDASVLTHFFSQTQWCVGNRFCRNALCIDWCWLVNEGQTTVCVRVCTCMRVCHFILFQDVANGVHFQKFRRRTIVVFVWDACAYSMPLWEVCLQSVCAIKYVSLHWTVAKDTVCACARLCVFVCARAYISAMLTYCRVGT